MNKYSEEKNKLNDELNKLKIDNENNQKEYNDEKMKLKDENEKLINEFSVVLVVTQPDKRGKRGNSLTFSPVKELVVGQPVVQHVSVVKEILLIIKVQVSVIKEVLVV